ncbi:holo-ACP synthase [Paenibacillus sp. IB182496]|uniref:Holo-[acyl-carrier-protein] synthase n=1 Tax=Paenibacillus sabuli TaxID=2772509 RepID=A0A927BXN9_9BACL|nr:holo-ACP synthase [Paenibacillus sabuli]MBD2847329.1 holo-ACP synthase [Paenibacillus sabuli]
MIQGIGHDIVDIARVRRILEGQAGARFLARILTPAEQSCARARGEARLAEFVSGRFAAKEAVVKALGCGIGAHAGFGDIEIMPDALGRPACRLSARTRHSLGLPEAEVTVHVTITHERLLASAFAIAERHQGRSYS